MMKGQRCVENGFFVHRRMDGRDLNFQLLLWWFPVLLVSGSYLLCDAQDSVGVIFLSLSGITKGWGGGIYVIKKVDKIVG